MKKKFVLFALISLLGVALMAEKSQAQPNPCWKLVCPHDPANGMFNPDSVYVDTCQTSDSYLHYFLKGWITVSLDLYGKLIFPEFSPDTTVYIEYPNQDTSLWRYNITLRQLDSLYGTFIIKKKYPECADSLLFASYLYQIAFNNYIDYMEFRERMSNFYKPLKKAQIFAEYNLNTPTINGIGPYWTMAVKNIGQPYDVNPDSVYWDKCLMRYYNSDTNNIRIDSEKDQYAKQCWGYYLKDTIPYLTKKDTLMLSDLDSAANPSMYDYFKYLEKEKREIRFTYDQGDRIGFNKYSRISDRFPFADFVVGNIQGYFFYVNHIRLGTPDDKIDYPSPTNKNIIIDNLSVNTINFKYQQTNSNTININIFNSISEKVIDVFSGYLESGEHNYTIDISNLPAGVYFIVLNSGMNRSFCKFIKV